MCVKLNPNPPNMFRTKLFPKNKREGNMVHFQTLGNKWTQSITHAQMRQFMNQN